MMRHDQHEFQSDKKKNWERAIREPPTYAPQSLLDIKTGKKHSTHHLWKNRREKNFNEDPRAMDGRPQRYQLVFKGEQMPTTTMEGNDDDSIAIPPPME